MRIGSRLFPYPTVNFDQAFSKYVSGTEFKLDFEKDGEALYQTRYTYILKNVRFELNNEALLDLYNKGKLICMLIAESSDTVFRERHEIYLNEKKDIILNKDDLSGNLEVSAYLIAKENIEDFHSEDFKSFYRDYTFNIEKNCILAIDDGFKIPVIHSPSDDRNVASIFEIIRDEEAEKLLTYQVTQDKIQVYLPAVDYDNYIALTQNSRFLDLSFAILIMPVLIDCLANIHKSVVEENYGTIEDIIDSYHWMNSIVHSYKKETGKSFTLDVFMEKSPIEIAQIVFNYSTLNGLERLNKVLQESEEDE